MYLLEARAKIERANVHIGDVDRRLKALEQTDTAVIEIHPEHGTERLIHTVDESAFNDLALIVGDAVHNLNCALDYTWLQTIERLVPDNVKDRAKFPVHKTIEELKGALRKGKVDATCLHLYTFIVDKIQPYDGGNPAIWPIHCFANRDKHRLLIPVLAEGLRCRMKWANGGPDPASALPKNRLIASTSPMGCTSQRRASLRLT
jgi:hypothetical protein